MGRLIRNFLLFIFMVALITGLFFGTRGFGLIEESKLKFNTITGSKLPLGPILAKKGRDLILYPGMNLWRKIDPTKSDWHEKAVHMIAERVEKSLDSILYVEEINKEEIVEFVNQAIGNKLKEYSFQDIASGVKTIDLNLSEFIAQNSQYLRSGVSGRMDSLINKIEPEEIRNSGNF